MWTPRIISPTSSLGYWSQQSLDFGTDIEDSGPATTGCDRVMVVWTRSTPTGTVEDTATINLHVYKEAGALASSFSDTADLNAVNAILDTWIASVMSLCSAQWTAKEYRFYRRHDDLEDTGPPIRVDAISVVGGIAATRLPDQMAASVSLHTASRRNWGRVYIPGISSANTDLTYGRLANAACTGLKDAFRTMANSLDTAGFQLCIWSPTTRAVLDITKIDVDNVMDVIRRRRARQQSFRATAVS